MDVLAAAPSTVVDELAALLGMPSPNARPAVVAALAPPPVAPPRPTGVELRAALDAVVLAAAEEHDVLPRHLRAFGVELLLAVDRAGLGAKEAAALVAGGRRPRRG